MIQLIGINWIFQNEMGDHSENPDEKGGCRRCPLTITFSSFHFLTLLRWQENYLSPRTVFDRVFDTDKNDRDFPCSGHCLILRSQELIHC